MALSCWLVLLLVLLETDANEVSVAGQGHNATDQLNAYIRGLTVVRDLVAPLIVDKFGDLTVPLKASLDILYIRGVNDAEQTVITSSYLSLTWCDAALAWDPALYEGVDFVELPSNIIWIPDVIVVNSVDTKKPTALIDFLTVFSNGSIEIKVFMSIETVCPMDHTLFPFDKQSCPIILYAFSSYIRWNLSSRSFADSAESQQVFSSDWDLVQIVPAVLYLPQYQKTVPMVEMTLQRKTTFYNVCLILPMILTSYMNTLVFLVPLDSGEKVSFLVNIFVSTSVYISFFSDVMPRGLDEMPGSMELMICVTVESLIVLLITLLILRRFYDEQEVTQCSKCSADHQAQNEPSQEDNKVRNYGKQLQLSSESPNLLNSRLMCSCLDRQQEGPPEERKAGKRKKWLIKVTAQHLDNIFFVLSFLCNTAALCAILFTALIVGNDLF